MQMILLKILIEPLADPLWYGDCNQGINICTMSSLLYIVAVILIIGWVLGFFVFKASSLIHVLLVIAVIAILLRLIRGRDPV